MLEEGPGVRDRSLQKAGKVDRNWHMQGILDNALDF
jgi:hypothetical protein